MSHKHFGMKDSMRQTQVYIGPTDPDIKRKAAIVCAASVPKDELLQVLDMLGLKDD